jgi:hypothetical protein
LIAMSIFTSPALSTMELFMPVDKLPRAMAILTIVANLLYALEPVVVDIIDYLGASVTFITGGVVVFISGYALKKNSLGLFKSSGNKEAKPIASIRFDTQKSQYGFILFLGTVLGAATTVMFNVFPAVLEAKLGAILNNANGKVILVGILVFSALLSWPSSNAVNRYGMMRVFWISFAWILLSTASILLFSPMLLVMVMLLVFAIAFTALSVSALPLAINRSNYYEKVFCVGIFFSGVAVPDGMLQIVQAL